MWIFLSIASALFIALVVFTIPVFLLWIQARISGAPAGFVELLLMPLRKVDPKIVVKCKVMAAQSQLDSITTAELEAHLLAGGNIHKVTLALIAADRSGIDLSWNTAAAIDLAGRDILEAVQVSVNPKVIQCPDNATQHGETLYGVAQDGIQLKVRVMVTVKTNLSRLVGGATESTVVARVGQGIIAAIGKCESYSDALCDPMVITRKVLEQGLDAQTVFAILSIDIADIDVGINIGAQLLVDQAAAEVRVAEAEAEKRRAMAIALQQEMRAKVVAQKSSVLLAETEIPRALAKAIIEGNLETTQFDSWNLPAV